MCFFLVQKILLFWLQTYLKNFYWCPLVQNLKTKPFKSLNWTLSILYATATASLQNWAARMWAEHTTWTERHELVFHLLSSDLYFAFKIFSQFFFQVLNFLKIELCLSHISCWLRPYKFGVPKHKKTNDDSCKSIYFDKRLFFKQYIETFGTWFVS